ncbi:hypothetical protein EYR41_011052 [Orbilia oligospora]|uniref:Uncharacterized protein n=1 Tax=Orbilia oligospora TaxID=2813651 RepID=A0A8H2HL06_ORBOL|nr:hypothetical protein TWF132_008183 [Orbilia oligospora]TGJ63108.1 hypothetical protein EYR41_011052 [Orbilia oligospora]
MKASQTSPDAQYIQYKVHRNLSHHCFTHCRPPLTTPPSSSPIPPTGLSRLPNELLFQIFSYLLTSSTPIIISDFQKQDVSTTTSSYANFTNRLVNHYIGASSGLFLADKKISNAALEVLYSSNKFILKLRVNFTRAFLLSIGEVNRARIKYLQVGVYSKLSSNTWQYNLKREFERLGTDIDADMVAVRELEYKSEWTHGKDFPVGDIGVEEIVRVERKGVEKFHEKLLKAWGDEAGNVRVEVVSSFADLYNPKGEQIEVISSPPPDTPAVKLQSGTSSLPYDVLREILLYCHSQKEVFLSGPHNYFSLQRRSSHGPLDIALKHHSPCFDYYSLFLVSPKISKIMREGVYSNTRFRVRDRGLATLSCVLNEEDFNMIKDMELVLGHPNQERMKFVVLCLKGVIWRLLKSGSKIKKVTIKVDRLSAPYLGTMIPLLRELRKKSELILLETLGTDAKLKTGDSFGVDMGKENDIAWMLDDQTGVTTWTWSWAQNGWRDFGEVIGREEGERDRVGKVNGLKERKGSKSKGKSSAEEKGQEEAEGAAESSSSRNTRRPSETTVESMRRRASKSKGILKKWVSDLH